jgi:hypothetical protein
MNIYTSHKMNDILGDVTIDPFSDEIEKKVRFLFVLSRTNTHISSTQAFPNYAPQSPDGKLLQEFGPYYGSDNISLYAYLFIPFNNWYTKRHRIPYMILNLEFAIVPFLQYLCGFQHIEFVNRTSLFAGTYFKDLWTDCMHMAIQQLKSMDINPYQFSGNPTMLYTYLRGSSSIAKLVNFIALPMVCAVVPQILTSESSIMLFPDGGDSDNYKEKCANYVSSDFDGLSEDEKSRLIFQKSPIKLYLDDQSVLSCCEFGTSVDFYFHPSRYE